MKKCIVLLSGGMDSTVSFAAARKRFSVELCLFFDYGQKAAIPEKKAVTKISRRLNAPLEVVPLPFLAAITGTSLVNSAKKIPAIKISQLDRRNITAKTARTVWVPNRNGLFINIAAAYAESLGCSHIITGFNREEAAAFPDNSTMFVKAINRSLSYSTMAKIKVVSFTQDLTKDEIIRLGMALDAPIELSWSCYRGNFRQCMKCESCLRLKRALIRTNQWKWFMQHQGI